MLTYEQIIRAWKDEDYLESLTFTFALTPHPPARRRAHGVPYNLRGADQGGLLDVGSRHFCAAPLEEGSKIALEFRLDLHRLAQ